MGNLVYFHWGPSLENYVAYYDQAFYLDRAILEYEVSSSAKDAIATIVKVAEEEDGIEIELLAKQLAPPTLRSVLLLSSSTIGVLYLARPKIIRGCIKLMKTIKVNDSISPFSYEYGYLCFNIAKMSLGVCLVEKLNREHIGYLMEQIRANYLKKDNPSILTEYLASAVLNEIQLSQEEGLLDWIFGWADPPAHGGHSHWLLGESDALDLMNIVWADRKAFSMALASSYTPGTSIVLLLFWQCMLKKSIFKQPTSQHHVLEPFLDLVWRFTLVATANDYPLVLRIVEVANIHLKYIRGKAIDIEDSRCLLRAYIKGISPVNQNSYRQTLMGIYPHLPYFIARNILPGTEDLFPALIESLLDRLWEMITWEGDGAIAEVADVIGVAFIDICSLLHACATRLPPRSPVMQAVLGMMADNDLLGMAAYGIQRLDPNKQYNEPTLCSDFRKDTVNMIVLLTQAASSSIIPDYFPDYVSDWLKLLQHGDLVLLMENNSEDARSCVKFRQKLIRDVISGLGHAHEGLLMQLLRLRNTLTCNYFAMSDIGLDKPDWAKATQPIMPEVHVGAGPLLCNRHGFEKSAARSGKKQDALANFLISFSM
ncbi:hypothetical protein FRC11_000942 [Ceratobasidium sp. 423]|nr:hypothetical protein FRC11_000942 [Ceratobasidium sp. 423]